MGKKNSFSQVVCGQYWMYRLILLSLFFAAYISADSRKVASDIESYFSNCNAALTALCQEVGRHSATKAQKPLEKTLNDFPGIELLIWVNSKGVVVNEVVRNGKPGRPHRNLSRQKWYANIKKLKPYYSKLKTRKGNYKLFWCEPIRIKRSRGDRSGGAIVTKIDLRRSFDTVAKKISTPFRVILEGKPIYSHAWKSSYDSTAVPLVLKGIEDLQVSAHGKKPAPPPAAAAKPPEEKKRSPFFTVKRIIVFASLIVVFIILSIIVKAVVRMKHEALIRRIEGDEPVDTSFDKPPENGPAGDDVRTAQPDLPQKGQQFVPGSTGARTPPEEKRSVSPGPVESAAQPGEAVLRPEEFSAVEKKKEKKSVIPPAKKIIPEFDDNVPQETQALKPEVTDFIRDIKPRDEADEITVPDEKSAAAPEPKERVSEYGAKIDQPQEMPDAEEQQEAKPEISSSLEETRVMDIIPPEPQAVKSELDDFIKEVKSWDWPEKTAASAEKTSDTIPPDIMDNVEDLLRKHLNTVLEERIKQIEQEVLARVMYELAGRMKGGEE